MQPSRRLLGRSASIARWIGIGIIILFATTRTLLNHLAVGEGLRFFVSAIPSVVNLTGPLAPSDVTIHDLSMSFDSDGLTLGAFVSASGPVGDVVLAVEGRQKKEDAAASFRLISVRKSHCYLSLFCE
jgi:hypothetical protein